MSIRSTVTRRSALQAVALASLAPAAAVKAATPPKPEGADAAAKAWPTQPVRLLIGFPPGSVQDLSARALTPSLAAVLQKPVVVENKPGASGTIAAATVARASDLHTFGVMNNSQLTVAKLLNPAIAYDPITDLAPVALVATAPLMLVVSNASTGSTPAGHIQWLRDLGDRGNFGSPGNGTPGHLGMELLKSRAQLHTAHIPYPGNPQVVTALIANQLQAALLPPGLALQQVQAGKFKAVGVTSEERSPLAPNEPSLRELDIRGADIDLWSAVAAPASLPGPIAQKLGAAVLAALKDADTRQRLLTAGWLPTPSTREGLASRMQHDLRTFGGIILMRNIRADS